MAGHRTDSCVTFAYLLPIKAEDAPTAEQTEYLRGISSTCRVVIVDGSAEEVFAAAHVQWAGFACHLRPDDDITCRNGKVRNVLTGLRRIDEDVVIIADDDVRYSLDTVVEVVAAMSSVDLVVPQNYFDPLPWHAVWDTARILLNRALGHDFPGTLVVRTEALRRTGGYDGDVLFENLELIRTIDAAGGSWRSRPDVYVRRLPPTAAHFRRQRVRQAYDELARPHRLVAQLAIIPGAALLGRRSASLLVVSVAAAAGVAEVGRRRHGGTSYFPARASLCAAGWLIERGACAWLAMLAWCRGGVTYSDGRLRRAANSPRALRQRMIDRAGTRGADMAASTAYQTPISTGRRST